MKLTKKVLSGTSYLSYELGENDIIDTTSFGMLSNNKIDGLINVQQFRDNGKESLNYDISSKVPLNEYLYKYVNNESRLQILINITSAILLASDYMLLYTQFIKELDYVYIDERTLDIYLIYLPLENYENEIKFNSFMQNLVYSMKYEPNSDASHIIDIHNYLISDTDDDLDITYLEEFKKLLQNLKRRERSYSPNINSMPNRQGVAIPVNNIPNRQNVSMLVNNAQSMANTAMPTNNIQNRQSGVIQTNNVPNRQNISKPVNNIPNTAPKNIVKPQPMAMPNKVAEQQKPKGSVPSFQIPGKEKPIEVANSKKVEKKGIFPFFGKKKDDKKLDKNVVKNESAQHNINVNVAPVHNMPSNATILGNMDETTVLSQIGSDETTVLGVSNTSIKFARLKRKVSGEIININKNSFMIGKDRYSVDYIIENNSSVSRNHAKIFYENGRYIISDNNSLNGTYLNGNKLGVGMAMELQNGDIIVLANEVFEFLISDM